MAQLPPQDVWTLPYGVIDGFGFDPYGPNALKMALCAP